MPGQKKYALIALITLCVCVLALYIHRHREGKTGKVDNFIISTLGHMQGSVLSLAQGSRNIRDHYIFLVNSSKENNRLSQEVDELKQKIIELEEVRIENERLRQSLNFGQTLEAKLRPAHVIAHDVSPDYYGVRIDQGSDHGVAVGMGVISPQGVVGRVHRVAPRYADVLTLMDPGSSIDVIVQRSRARGILSGQSKQLLCRLKYVDRLEDVVVNDAIISSDYGGRFPKGLLVGTVIAISPSPDGLLQNITVKSAVDIFRLEEVFVVLSGEQSEKTS